MYCTAKTDEHSTPEKADTGDLDRSPHQQATDQLVPQQGSILAALEHDLVPSYIANVQSWIRGSQSMATIDDSSAMFVSCTSMPNLQSPAANNQTIGMLTPRAGRRSMSIESVLADVAAQLSPVMSAIEDPIDSESDSEYITGSETGSSSRSSFVEITSVENEAYRCSGRFAPRLSTIERAHDGRLQIKPNDTPLQNAHALSPTESTPRFGAISEILAKDCTVGADSGNESATDASPQSETHAVPECGDDMTDICQVGGFPLAPNAICIQQRDKPNLFHGSNTGGDVTIADPSRILLSISLNSSESNGQDGVDPGNEQTSPELASPPMSPDRLRTVTVNTSVDTAETAKADSAPVSPISRKNGHSECDPYKADQQPSIESEPSSLMQQVVHNTIVHSETESERSIVGASEEAVSNTHGVELCDDSGLLSRHQRHAEGVGLSLFANENQISGSRMFSIFSDVSQSDMSLLNASQSLPDQYYGQFSQLSLLFDGHQQSIVQSVVGDTSSDGASAGLGVSQTATNTREYRGEIATAFSGNQFDNRGSTARGINRNAKNHNKGTECDDNGDDDDDEMALSEIIAINRAVISPPTPAQNSDAPDQPLSQEPKEPSEIQSGEPSSPEDDASNRPSFSSLASRTRKLSTALGSFRNLHRKIRSTATGAPGRAAAITDDSSSSGDGVNTHASHLSGGKEFRFNELVAVYETWNRDEYDRKGMPSAKLDSEAIEQIKHELNEFKVYEMQVHEDSRQHTHFIY
ncbi:hypothetical protein LPJ53_000367 [Coemansia erecta]|uniref:Uncharacterized protein n=1 Tax=Coemansia erecta TaxID=147472 RepID=A0A9W7Y6H7_9FUNG|nr:hypothetical protein LPJ53_000367 [Coemansia erecta]